MWIGHLEITGSSVSKEPRSTLFRLKLAEAATKTVTAKRFSCVLGMLSSLEVKVLRPT